MTLFFSMILSSFLIKESVMISLFFVVLGLIIFAILKVLKYLGYSKYLLKKIKLYRKQLLLKYKYLLKKTQIYRKKFRGEYRYLLRTLKKQHKIFLKNLRTKRKTFLRVYSKNYGKYFAIVRGKLTTTLEKLSEQAQMQTAKEVFIKVLNILIKIGKIVLAFLNPALKKIGLLAAKLITTLKQHKPVTRKAKVASILQRLEAGKSISQNSIFYLKKYIYEMDSRLKKKLLSGGMAFSGAVLVSVLIVTLILPAFISQNSFSLPAGAATYNWSQSDFSGGASTTAEAVHDTNQSNWTYYYSKDADITLGTIATGTPVAQWSFDGAFTDSIGSNDGTASGTTATAEGVLGTAAYFDGNNDFVTIADDDALDLQSNFTISAWVKKGEQNKQQTILSKGAYVLGLGEDNRPYFEMRTGSETLTTVAGGSAAPTDMQVYDGKLYSVSSSGLLRYDGGTSWTTIGSVASDFRGRNPGSIANYNSKLFVGTAGSLFDGLVFRHNGVNDFTYQGSPGESSNTRTITNLVNYEGDLYANISSLNTTYRYTEKTSWESAGASSYKALVAYNGNLYTLGISNQNLLRYDGGTTWTTVASIDAPGQVSAMAVYDGNLYVGDTTGIVFLYDGDSAFTSIGQPGDENSIIQTMIVYRDKFYVTKATVNPTVYRYNGGSSWTSLATPPNYQSKVAAVYDGKLYTGTNSNYYGDGTGLYSSDEINDQWNQLIVSYDGSIASLYVNGVLVATSSKSMTPENNTSNLYIGRGYGSHKGGGNIASGEDNFRGNIDEVKIYDSALDSSAVLGNYSQEKYLSGLYLASTSTSITESSDTDFTQGATSSISLIGTGADAYLSLEQDSGGDDTSAYTFPDGPTPIFRSVGPGSTNEIASGTPSNTMTISSGVATFSSALADNIGVGDAIVYDDDGDNDIDLNDSIVFIHSRASSTEYTVMTESGTSTGIVDVTNEDDWIIYRAYTSLANAENGDTNDTIDAIGITFDTWINGQDLTSTNEIWNIALYADAVDTAGVSFNGWTVATTTYVRLYTPYLESEVGVSQRHNGVWDTTKYILKPSADDNSIHVDAGENQHLRIDGLQIETTSSDSDQRIGINMTTDSVGVRISNNIIREASGISSSTVQRRGIQARFAENADNYIYNNIIYGFLGSNSSCIHPRSSTGSENTNAFIFNNTVVGCERGIDENAGTGIVLKNNLAFGNVDDYVGTFSSANNAVHIGSGDEISRTASLSGLPLTLMAYGRMTEEGGWQAAFDLIGTGGHFWVGANQTEFFNYWNGSTNFSGSALATSTWYHMAIVVSAGGSSNVSVYLDGELDITGDLASFSSPTEAEIGGRTDGTDYWLGDVAAFKMWNAALTQGQIQAEMNQYYPLITDNLISYVPLITDPVSPLDDEGSSATWSVAGDPTVATSGPVTNVNVANNAYSEGTDPGSGGLDISASASTTIFVDPANRDYRLKTGSPVIDQGVDLSSDPDLAFSNDITKELRPNGAAWDIGADEYSLYTASGTFTSQIHDTSTNSDFDTVTWTETVPASTTMYVKIRTSNSASMTGATAWADCNPVWSGTDISTNNCVTDGERYFEYRVEMTTEKIDTTPTFSDITVNYSNYVTDIQSLTSSPFDTNSPDNLVAGLVWDDKTATGTVSSIYLRTGSSSAAVLAASWVEIASSTDSFLTSGCTKSGITVTCDVSTIPAGFKDGSDDRWVQYRVDISGDGQYTPAVGNVRVTYVVNAAPGFNSSFGTNGVDLYQIATSSDTYWGQVRIEYAIRDVDATSGTESQNHVTPSFEYSFDGGGAWTSIASTSIALATTSASGDITDANSDGDLDLFVEEGSYINYLAFWDAAADIATSSSALQIRVTIDDNESANNTAQAVSATATLDSASPSLTSPALVVGASTTPATLHLSATDDSDLFYEVAQGSASSSCLSALGSDFDTAYTATTSLSLAEDPRVVCIQFRDDWGATSSVVYATTPTTPLYPMVQDTSNIAAEPDEYRLFVAWKVISAPDPGFARYNVYRSTTDSNFSLYTTVSDINTNYYADSSVDFNQDHYYKVSSVDSDGNESFLSSSVYGKANGTQDAGEGGGGTDATGPVITNVTSTASHSNQVTINWDTDEVSNSIVNYGLATSSLNLWATSTSQRDTAAGLGQHEVVISGLDPSTTYYYQVRSVDPIGNVTTNNNDTSYYSFTTSGGPVISNISAVDMTNTTAVITWNTDIAASSKVTYSTNDQLTGSSEQEDLTLATSHSVTISGLTANTVYYFQVESTDGSSNVALDTNNANYYSFITTADSVAPTITSGPSASSIGDTYTNITWVTNEKSTSIVNYGTVSGTYTATSSDSNLNFNHTNVLTGLSAKTTYYYRVISADANGNEVTSAESSFTTKEKLYQQSELDSQVEAAENANIGGGGGLLRIDTSDKVAPVISDVKISDIRANSAMVSWLTDEDADSLVEYGFAAGDYEFVDGDGISKVQEHNVKMSRLAANQNYNFRVVSEDLGGNVSHSDDISFRTLSEAEEIIKGIKEEFEEDLTFEEINELADSEQTTSELYAAANTAIDRAADIFRRISGQISVGNLEATLMKQYESIKDLASLIPSPFLVGEPRVVTTARTASIAWGTDKESNSLVAIAPEENYNPNAEDPYLQVVGNFSERTTNHAVTIHDLEPDTLYHYQLRSQADIGPEARSEDFTFQTKKEELSIDNFAVENISLEEVVFKWLTNVEANSKVRYTPYRNNILIVEEAKEVVNKAVTIQHEVTVDDLEGGVVYKVELISVEPDGTQVSREIDGFVTSEDNFPPRISYLRTSSALSSGAEDTVQTIVSWRTNELATRRVYFSEGIVAETQEMDNKTQISTDFSKEHIVVITKFEPGKIYTIRVENIDSGGNVTISKNYTILTPRQKESVFQIIMKNIEEIFGWVGNF